MDFKKALETDISQFIDYFKLQVKNINGAKFEDRERLYKKLLLNSLIDALSKTIYPTKGNAERFTKFIQNFTGWENWNRVSIPHLNKLLRILPDTDFNKVREYVIEKYEALPDGLMPTLESDPLFGEVLKYWPQNNGKMKTIGNITLVNLRHDFLFYSLRNFLVHELRHPGAIKEDQDDIDPYYLSSTNLGNNETSWILVYPYIFFNKICEKTLEKLELYFKKNMINPYEMYKFGDYLIDELNT